MNKDCALLQSVNKRIFKLGKKGQTSRPPPGTARWDLKAIDHALDVLRGVSFSESSAFDECQRQGDPLRLPWSSYDRGYLRLRQSKTGRRIVTPAGLPPKVLLDGTERRGPLILTNSSGRL
jgi:hypothetical protein